MYNLFHTVLNNISTSRKKCRRKIYICSQHRKNITGLFLPPPDVERNVAEINELFILVKKNHTKYLKMDLPIMGLVNLGKTIHHFRENFKI
jgi:hypothetical protein